MHKFLSCCFIRLMAFYSFFTILLALHNIPHTSKASSIDQPSLIIHLITTSDLCRSCSDDIAVDF